MLKPMDVSKQQQEEVSFVEEESKLLKTPKQLRQDPSGFTYYVVVDKTPHTNLQHHLPQPQINLIQPPLQLDLDDRYQNDMNALDQVDDDEDDDEEEEEEEDDDDDYDFDILPDPQAFVKNILAEIPQEISTDEKFILFNQKIASKYSKNPEKMLIMQKLTQNLQEILQLRLQQPEQNIQAPKQNDDLPQEQFLPRWDFEVKKSVLKQTQQILQHQITQWTQLQQQFQSNQFVNQYLPSKQKQNQSTSKENGQNQQNVDVDGQQCDQNYGENKENIWNDQEDMYAESKQILEQLLKCRRDVQIERMFAMGQYVDTEERLQLYLQELEQKLDELELFQFKQKMEQYDHLQSPAVLINKLTNQEDYMMEQYDHLQSPAVLINKLTNLEDQTME
eukprot:TRINITY_DN2064_c1_g1_i8.p1 TRINITY_DN2064_c1_g1~~TRINITY_DN2064_c1_g1_i8.p1  ORF type:complete len:391 (-),score=75.06 TRINITY_DN2064_c1_g1_i8:132-1304(-)